MTEQARTNSGSTEHNGPVCNLERPATLLNRGDWATAAIEIEMKLNALRGGPPALSFSDWGSVNDEEELLKAIEGLGARLITQHADGDGDGKKTFILPSGYVRCPTGDSPDSIEGILTDPDAYQILLELVKKHIRSPYEERPGHIYMLASTPTGLKPFSLGVASVPIEKCNYAEEVNDDFDYVIRSIQGGDPFGRLVLLEGPPGSGKTYLIRHIIHELPRALFVYAPTSIVGELDSPHLVPTLLSLRDETCGGAGEIDQIVLVVEDADELIESRTELNRGQLSTLLNLTSGILGDLTNMFVIASYNNVAQGSLDTAIVRRGRMLKHIKVSDISHWRATAALRRLLGEDTPPFNSSDRALLKDVYAEARKRGWSGHG